MPPKHAFSAHNFLTTGKVGQNQFSQLKSWSVVNFPMLTDEQLVLFLFGRENNVKVAKKAIVAFFASKLEAPELFSPGDIDKPDFRNKLEIYELGMMPERTENGCLVFFGRLKNSTFSKFDFDSLIKISNMIGELSLYKDPPDGSIVVVDLKDVPLSYLLKVKLSSVAKSLKYLLEGFPYTVRQFHVFNTVSFINKILFLVKPFLNPQLLNSVHFHSSDLDMDDFFKNWLPRKCVPEDYGGDGPSLEHLTAELFNSLRQMKTFYEDGECQLESIASKYTDSQIKQLKLYTF